MSNYPPGVSDRDFVDYNDEEWPDNEPDDEMHFEAQLSGTPWPMNAVEAAQCTPITLWNRTYQDWLNNLPEGIIPA